MVRADDGVLEQSHALTRAAVGLGTEGPADVVNQTERGPGKDIGICQVQETRSANGPPFHVP